MLYYHNIFLLEFDDPFPEANYFCLPFVRFARSSFPVVVTVTVRSCADSFQLLLEESVELNVHLLYLLNISVDIKNTLDFFKKFYSTEKGTGKCRSLLVVVVMSAQYSQN